MALTALIQIFTVNPVRTGSKDGRAWAMQDAECALLKDDGTVDQVGVLMLPKDLREENAPKAGVYHGQFTMQRDMRTRQLGAALVGLTPVQATSLSKVAAKA
jgi:hypothetical protein